MKHCIPHFHLISKTNVDNQPGRWQFVLQAQDNSQTFGDVSAGDQSFVGVGTEEDIRGERLDLLCLIRALEALDQPSRVSLVTSSAYVREGIRYGLPQWRENGWKWEAFGRMVPVKNCDFWQRVDAALQFHSLECCVWRFDASHGRQTDDVLEEKTRILWNNLPRRLAAARFATDAIAWARRRIAPLVVALLTALRHASPGADACGHALRTS